MAAMNNAIYQMIPRELGRIDPDWYEEARKAKALGCNILYLSPFHPSTQEVFPIDPPHVKKPNGMYAIHDAQALHAQHSNARAAEPFSALGPNDLPDALRERDREDIRKFTRYVREELGMELMADLVVNHEAADSPRYKGTDPRHPGSQAWFKQDASGAPIIVGHNDTSISGNVNNPWSDIIQIDWERLLREGGKPYRDAIAYMQQNVDSYIDLGFDHFRVDIPALVPPQVYDEIFAHARKTLTDKYPRQPEKAEHMLLIGETLGIPPKYDHAQSHYKSGGFTHGMESIAWAVDPASPPEWLLDNRVVKYAGFADNFVGFVSSHDSISVLTRVVVTERAETLGHTIARHIEEALQASPPEPQRELLQRNLRRLRDTLRDHQGEYNAQSQEEVFRTEGQLPEIFNRSVREVFERDPDFLTQKIYKRLAKIAFLTDGNMVLSGEGEGRIGRVDHHRDAPLQQEKLYDLRPQIAAINRTNRLVPERAPKEAQTRDFFIEPTVNGQEAIGAIRRRNGEIYIPLLPAHYKDGPLRFAGKKEMEASLGQMIDLYKLESDTANFIVNGECHKIARQKILPEQVFRENLDNLKTWVECSLDSERPTLPEIPTAMFRLAARMVAPASRGQGFQCTPQIMQLGGVPALVLRVDMPEGAGFTAAAPIDPQRQVDRGAFLQDLTASVRPAPTASVAENGEILFICDHPERLNQEAFTSPPRPLADAPPGGTQADRGEQLGQRGRDLADSVTRPPPPPPKDNQSYGISL